MKLEYHPSTATDLNRATEYYDGKQPGLGDDCRDEIYHTIDQISANPYRYRVVQGDIRRCFVHRFPFSVLYRVLENDVVRILTVRHHRQHPNFGLRRT